MRLSDLLPRGAQLTYGSPRSQPKHVAAEVTPPRGHSRGPATEGGRGTEAAGEGTRQQDLACVYI